MTLREKYPFKPHEVALHRTTEKGEVKFRRVEVISWPYPDESGEAVINVRETVGDPATLVQVDCKNLRKATDMIAKDPNDLSKGELVDIVRSARDFLFFGDIEVDGGFEEGYSLDHDVSGGDFVEHMNNVFSNSGLTPTEED